MGAPRNDVKAAAMYDLYQKGYSLAAIAKTFSMTRSGAYNIFKRREWPLRSRPEPLPFVVFAGHRYTLRNTGYYGRTNGKRTLLHRDIWESRNGPIPDGFDVHHLNRDRTNNRIENLALITRAEHARRYPGRQNQFTKRR